jgi:hypothetical protein
LLPLSHLAALAVVQRAAVLDDAQLLESEGAGDHLDERALPVGHLDAGVAVGRTQGEAWSPSTMSA